MFADFNFMSQFTVAAMLGVTTLAAISDIRSYRIPNTVNLTLLALYPLYVMSTPGSIPWVQSLIIAASVFALGSVVFSFGLLGGGDVKLLTVISLWAGPAHFIDFLFVTALAGGVLALIMITPTRHVLALAFDAIGQSRLREAVLAEIIPYGLAIAAGAGVVGVRLLSG